MSETAQAEILAASLAPHIVESGGSYGQKGVDFQRYWAIIRIIELAGSPQPDFLILFESLQDVVEFDHSTSPTKAKVYQLKAKGTGEWTWHALTALPPTKPRKTKGGKELTIPKMFDQSPIGKLTATVAELGTLSSEGIFVSNLGSTADLAKGSQAGSLQLCKFSELSEELRKLISPELQKLKKVISLDSLHLHKTPLSPDDPDAYVHGKVAAYLKDVAPKHISQCQPFSDSLFAILSSRGRKTEKLNSFSELVKQRGYSKAELARAVEDLKGIPDESHLIRDWLQRLLVVEKMQMGDYTRLQIEVTRRVEERLTRPPEDDDLVAVRAWVQENPPGDLIFSYLDAGVTQLSSTCKNLSKPALQAILIIEGIRQCLNQT
jgi:hypothetical protein